MFGSWSDSGMEIDIYNKDGYSYFMYIGNDKKLRFVRRNIKTDENETYAVFEGK